MVKKLLLAALWGVSALATAQSVFEVTLNPAPYSRDEARMQALDIVLTRLGGEQARQSWVQEEARSEITRYLQSESSGPGYQAEFNRQELEALLTSAGLPFVTSARPSLLVWLRQDGQVRNEASRSWKAAAERYQQPLLWPLWDLEEHMALNNSEAFSDESLRRASERYDAAYWLVMEQNNEPQSTTAGRWQLFAATQAAPLLQGRLNGDADAAATLMAELNDYWTRQAAQDPVTRGLRADNAAPQQPLLITEDGADELTILVSGLRQFSDTVLLERQLRQLEGVKSVYVVDSIGSQGRYRLSVPGSRAATLQALTTLSGLTPQGERAFSWSGS
ncbi:DUF2066 domain-containing protein [Oceanisphaera sp.]|uniref:DUF2066 domain-containing protein n=1 Tax=Oceanisphaera sp. TaxID=1929979 RepID=UPI003A932D35